MISALSLKYIIRRERRNKTSLKIIIRKQVISTGRAPREKKRSIKKASVEFAGVGTGLVNGPVWGLGWLQTFLIWVVK